MIRNCSKGSFHFDLLKKKECVDEKIFSRGKYFFTFLKLKKKRSFMNFLKDSFHLQGCKERAGKFPDS